MPDPLNQQQVQEQTDAFRRDYKAVHAEIAKAIVGHKDIVDGVLTCLFVGGHALLEGVPGLGKTALIRALSEALHLKFNRIQFTPDLMPADVIGTSIIEEDENGRRGFKFQEGPIFAQIVLADEINRATPKTQSAMLEAMQEKQVTAGGNVRKLDRPFFVMATQNPLEQEGTYPLPEAQLDRFFYKLVVNYSGRDELAEILNRTTAGHDPKVNAVLDDQKILQHQALVRQVVIAPHVQDYAIRCVLATHPDGEFAPASVNQFFRVGASPARRPGDHAGEQGPRPARRPVPRQLRGREGRGDPRDAPPLHPQLRGRGRGDDDGHRAATHPGGDADGRRHGDAGGGAVRKRRPDGFEAWRRWSHVRRCCWRRPIALMGAELPRAAGDLQIGSEPTWRTSMTSSQRCSGD